MTFISLQAGETINLSLSFKMGSRIINYTHIISQLGQSTEFPVDHHSLDLPRVEIISKENIYQAIGSRNTAC